MTVSEAQKAAEVVQKTISPTARIIWGAAVDPDDAEHDPGDAGGHRS